MLPKPVTAFLKKLGDDQYDGDKLHWCDIILFHSAFGEYGIQVKDFAITAEVARVTFLITQL